jgi:hypothetical protein
MKELTTAIYGRLAGSALDTAIGGRLFESMAPEGVELPYVVYFLVADAPADTFKDQLDDVLIQFSLFSDQSSSTEVKDLYGHLKTLYDDCALTVAGRTVVWMKRVRMSLELEDNDTWHCDVDYSIIQQR